MVIEESEGNYWSCVEVRIGVEQARRQLFAALDSLEGTKSIVWDKSLMRKVQQFASPQLFKQHDVAEHLALNNYKSVQSAHVVFFLSPTLNALDSLCAYIDKASNPSTVLYQVFFIPEAWYVIREKLKERENGHYWKRLESVKEIPLVWFPRDGECLSLSQPELPSRLLLNGDWTYLHRCAVALFNLLQIQASPSIPIYSRGQWAEDVARMTHKLRANSEQTPQNSSQSSLQFNRIVLIDRWLDPLSPMLTQLTYAGLLDELFEIGINASLSVSKCDFEENAQLDPFDQIDIQLDEELFHRLKHVHINAMGIELSKILQEIREDENYDKEKMSVAEYQLLVKKMPRILKRKKSAGQHMRLAEMSRSELSQKLSDIVKIQKELLFSSNSDKMVPFIEELIIEDGNLNDVLRLIAVHSLTAGGLKTTVLQQYRRMIWQSYGIEALNKFMKMQKMGLVREKGGSGKMACEHTPLLFQQMNKQYDLLPEHVNEMTPNDTAYAYSGYASLLVRIIEEGIKLRWAAWNKIGEEIFPNDNSQVALFVVGGLTRAEIASLRLLPQISLILTSSVTTGAKLLENITDI
ncbi:hypothetical protein WR25_25459 [Diploscapter pachys]|uniref:Sec1 family protein n=1 Tax=Diploscapter pachys TaxID=2018661 RepID=A0A2A2JNV9_9BILA|nr:hypothetical protein WR25_25459 [Diploscapter pachys]